MTGYDRVRVVQLGVMPIHKTPTPHRFVYIKMKVFKNVVQECLLKKFLRSICVHSS